MLPLDLVSKTSEPSVARHADHDSDADNDNSHEAVEPGLSPEQHLQHGHHLGEARADFERRYLKAALTQCHGNLAAAARCSGMDRSNFRRLLKRYGLHPGSQARI